MRKFTVMVDGRQMPVSEELIAILNKHYFANEEAEGPPGPIEKDCHMEDGRVRFVRGARLINASDPATKVIPGRRYGSNKLEEARGSSTVNCSLQVQLQGGF